MSNIELIAELTNICIRQAEIIKEQAYVLEQFGAQVREKEALAQRNRLLELAGEQTSECVRRQVKEFVDDLEEDA